MGNLLVDKRDVDFILYEQFDILELTKMEKFENFSKDEFDMVIEQGMKFALNVLAPVNEDGDRIGAKWNNGKVTLPESFHKPLKMFGEGGWVAACEEPELGGQGLPLVVFTACNEMFHAANTSLNLYPSLAHGTLTMIKVHGTDEQKKKYLQKLMSYEWAGTMNLTEPGAGSDLARVCTKAVKIDEKRYKISGQKIFITGGEHDGHPNIIHPVLARIEGDPEGIKGISIFLVPKYHINEDGSIGEPNDVTCAGIEHKMGLKGSATCQMSYGDNGNCIGEILGSPRHGISVMFLIMNEERLNVGVQGLGLASAAYLNALDYAKQRKQGVDVRLKGKSTDLVSIINHPDVRRNLLEMKAYVEGLRTLNYYTALCIDLRNAETDEKKKNEYEGMVEFLTPLCKAYSSIKGYDVCSRAVNTYGGYGYCQDYPVEQYLRDHKITALYEGTNAIHSIDLFSRKMRLNNGEIFKIFLENMQKTIDRARKNPSLAKYCDNAVNAKKCLIDAADYLAGIMGKGQVAEAFHETFAYLDIVGDTILGWMHLWQLDIAVERLEALYKSKNAASADARKKLVNENKEAAFYSGKISSARYFLSKILPLVEAKVKIIKVNDYPALEIEETAFGI